MAGKLTVYRQVVRCYTHAVLGLLTCIAYVILSSLFRFKHPSEGELCALAGKQMPKPSRRDRWDGGGGCDAAE